MDSGSTSILVLLVLVALSFIALRAADAALPLLRRAAVRDTLKEGSFRAAASRRLRTSREAYDELVQILSLVAASAAAALLVVELLEHLLIFSSTCR